MGTPVDVEPDLTLFATPEELAEQPPEEAQVGGEEAVVAGTWLPSTHRHPMPILAHGRRPQTRGIVLHVNDGYFDGTIAWFGGGSKGVGAHLEIGPDRVWQLVDLGTKCWHAVAANAFSIGFEHVGFGRQTRDAWLNSGHELGYSANRAAWVLRHYRLGPPKHGKNIWRHSDGGAAWGGHACPGAGFPMDVWIRMCNDAYHGGWGTPKPHGVDAEAEAPAAVVGSGMPSTAQ